MAKSFIRNFSDYNKTFEKIEFKDKFVEAVEKIDANDKIAKYLSDYMKDNSDDIFDWVEIADMFPSNHLIITSKENRPQVMKMTRFLRKILPINMVSAPDIDRFVLKLISEKITNDTHFEIWRGDKIRTAFDPDNFLKKDGDLATSCMSGKRYLPYFDIYCDNKNVSMLVLLHESKIVARAIVWNAFYAGVKYHVMDNVYAINEIEKKKMVQHANQNDWLHFYPKGAYFEDKNDKGFYGKFVVNLECVDFKTYPFVDNMTFLNKELKMLSNRDDGESYALHNKDGSIPACKCCQGEERMVCPDCEGTGSITDAGDPHFGENCKTCNGLSFIDCPKCKV